MILVDASEQYAVLLRALEKEVLEKRDSLAEFRARADQYCRDREADITKTLQHIEIIRTQIRERMKEPLVDDPLPAVGEVQARPASNTTQSDRVREAARIILSEAGEPVMQLDLKRRMEDRGIFIRARNPVDLIRAALRRSPEFKHVPNKGWTLQDAAPATVAD